MVLCAKAKLSDAQRVKRELVEHHAGLDGWRSVKDATHIYYPVAKKFPTAHATFVEHDARAVPNKGDLKERLRGALTDEELSRLAKSYDLVGTIAIIEIDPSLEAKERVIAAAVLEKNPAVTTVVKKGGGHEGELRLQRTVFLAGEETRETIVTENGVRLRVNVDEVYYSVRTASERLRVAEQVRAGERVLVMFSGVAPYCVVIAKRTKAAEVVGIELNEKGHALGVENVRLNKLKNVVLINDDVRHAAPVLAERGISFDRIVMPLPHTGSDFLDEAFAVSHPGTMIHLYDFEKEGEFDQAAAKAEAGAQRNKRQIKILRVVACGQHSPRLYRVCADFEVL